MLMHIFCFLSNIHNASTTSNPKKVQIREFNQTFFFQQQAKKTENGFVFENRNIFNIYFQFLMHMFVFHVICIVHQLFHQCINYFKSRKMQFFFNLIEHFISHSGQKTKNKPLQPKVSVCVFKSLICNFINYFIVQ